jgi:glutamate-1-semialdehyde 2,1-aminomutase
LDLRNYEIAGGYKIVNEEKLAQLREKIYDAYSRKTPKSKRMYHRAYSSLEGGVYASTRFSPPYPLYMSHGKGSKIYDVDSNEYIDCQLNAGPLLLGHCHPAVMEKVKRELDRGLLVYNLDLAIECAELLKEIMPCAERVRFANTGTEATLFAVRVARAFTGKNRIIKFYGHYHGLDDQFLVGTSHPSDEVICAGVPQESVANTVLLKYNDIDAVRRRLDEDNDIAGVILDPQMNVSGIWPPSREYLTELRQLTKGRGVILIFDEVITGFRLALGGAQEYFGVTPDLTILSKAIAAGGKLAALVGKEQVMATLAPRGLGLSTSLGVKKLAIQSGTYIDGTIALSSAIAALKSYKKLNEKGEYQRLFQLTGKLKAGIEMTLKEKGIPCHINMLGPLFKVFFTDLEPSFETYCNLDPTVLGLFVMSLVSEGVLPYGSFFFTSFAHTEEDVQRIIGAVNTSLDKYKFLEVL